MNTLFRLIPSVDKLLQTEQGKRLAAQYGHYAFVEQTRNLLAQIRHHIQYFHDLPDYLHSHGSIFNAIERHLAQSRQIGMQRVFNLTGTVLHTNLGRGLWSEQAVRAATTAMRNNVALEFDIDEGKRSHRDAYISELLVQLTGAEAACVVNNNAAAVLLCLATFAHGKEVIISRGELIEIGGAFRIPDIMAQAGCKLVEVGTTNRTHLKDYQNAITENTALLLKVHTSNYQIQGFTHSVSETDLVELGKQHQIPVFTDLGSGSLIDLSRFGLPAEPVVQEKIANGVDLVSFSGDKLLGGPQAGIIVGKKAMIEQLQSHPLKRVLRCDKVILSALEATLRHYLFPEQLKSDLPTLHLLTQSVTELHEKAKKLAETFALCLDPSIAIAIEESTAQIGSGALPTEQLPSVAVTLTAPTARDLLQLEQQLKAYPSPIIGRIAQQKLWLDLRSVAEFEQLLAMLNEQT